MRFFFFDCQSILEDTKALLSLAISNQSYTLSLSFFRFNKDKPINRITRNFEGILLARPINDLVVNHGASQTFSRLG